MYRKEVCEVHSLVFPCRTRCWCRFAVRGTHDCWMRDPRYRTGNWGDLRCSHGKANKQQHSLIEGDSTHSQFGCYRPGAVGHRKWKQTLNIKATGGWEASAQCKWEYWHFESNNLLALIAPLNLDCWHQQIYRWSCDDERWGNETDEEECSRNTQQQRNTCLHQVLLSCHPVSDHSGILRVSAHPSKYQ